MTEKVATEQSVVIAQVQPLRRERISIPIIGVTPGLLCHRFGEKAKRQMAEAMAGKGKSKVREKRDVGALLEASLYRRADGSCGVPAIALKSAMVGACRQGLKLTMTEARGMFFVLADDPETNTIRIIGEHELHEVPARPQRGGMDLRVRALFPSWRMDVTVEYNADAVGPEDLVNLLEVAGFSVGIGDWRPEKNGDFGRFQVERSEA
jgi:hypothetical protein